MLHPVPYSPCEFQDKIRCPHCYVLHDVHIEPDSDYNPNVICSSCNKAFVFYVHSAGLYTSRCSSDLKDHTMAFRPIGNLQDRFCCLRCGQVAFGRLYPQLLGYVESDKSQRK